MLRSARTDRRGAAVQLVAAWQPSRGTRRQRTSAGTQRFIAWHDGILGRRAGHGGGGEAKPRADNGGMAW